MKYTINLYDYINSELNRNNKNNQFISKNKFGLRLNSYIKKILEFDDDIYDLITYIFQGYCLSNLDSDKKFKQAFLNRFINRQIKFESIELFQFKLVSYFIENETYINECFNNLAKFAEGGNTSNTEVTNLNDNRTLSSTLPQNNINLNVDDTVLDYGNENVISRDKASQNTALDSQSFNPQNLLDIKLLINQIYDGIDKTCFKQIY